MHQFDRHQGGGDLEIASYLSGPGLKMQAYWKNMNPYAHIHLLSPKGAHAAHEAARQEA